MVRSGACGSTNMTFISARKRLGQIKVCGGPTTSASWACSGPYHPWSASTRPGGWAGVVQVLHPVGPQVDLAGGGQVQQAVDGARCLAEMLGQRDALWRQ